MGTNCAPFVADLFLFCYERDFMKKRYEKMKSLSCENQTDIIEAFNSTSKYLDDLLNIDNIYFDQMVDRVCPTELQLNRANSPDTEAPFLDLNLCISNGTVSTKIYDKRDDFDFDIVNFPFLDGDVPRRTSYGLYISQLIRFASLGEKRANLSAYRTFVRFVLVWICRFLLPLGVMEGLLFVIVALPGLFSYFFFFFFFFFCDCGTPWTFFLPVFHILRAFLWSCSSLFLLSVPRDGFVIEAFPGYLHLCCFICLIFDRHFTASSMVQHTYVSLPSNQTGNKHCVCSLSGSQIM